MPSAPSNATAQKPDPRVLFDLTPDVMMVADAQSVVMVNRGFCELLGWQASEVTGQPWAGLLHPDDLETAYGEAQRLTTGVSRQGDVTCRLKSKDGRYIPLSWRTCVDHGTGLMYVTGRDFRQQLTVEEALIEARERAVSAAEAKTKFLSIMSHEIRTPLSGITGMIEMLCRTKLSSEQEDYVSTLAGASRSLQALLADVMDYSRIDAGHMRLERSPVNLALLLETCLQSHHQAAGDQGNGLFLDYPVDLPATFWSDAGRLTQIFDNLISNAVKFTQNGRIDVGASADSVDSECATLKIWVADTGTGIGREALATLFKPFSQTGSVQKRRFDGTGLGLAICEGLVDLLGGDIDVQSTPGKGTRFTLTLPLKRASDNDILKAGEKHNVSVSAPTVACARALVVDDNPLNQRIAENFLQAIGVQDVKCAGDGKEAITRAAVEAYDIILMDIHMPEMDGLTATREIRDSAGPNQKTLIVGLSSHVMPTAKDQCAESGLDDYLLKPTTPQSLVRTIRHHRPQFDLVAAGETRDESRAQKMDSLLQEQEGVDSYEQKEEATMSSFNRVAFFEMLGGDGDAYDEISRTYLNVHESWQSKLAESQGARDLDRVRKAAHSIRGALASMADGDGAGLAAELEKTAVGSGADWSVVDERCKSLAVHMRAVADSLSVPRSDPEWPDVSG